MTPTPCGPQAAAARPPLLAKALARCPLIAILRGLCPHEAVEIGLALHGAGFSLIEVPLNSPDPLQSIRALRDALPATTLVGAGTVLEARDCQAIAEAGGQLAVMPHSDPEVIGAARAAGLACAAGVATPTEAFAALRAGATLLKLFPAETLGPAALQAWRAVIPAHVPVLPVGGITPASLPAWLAAGASGFGLGTALYRPGDDAGRVGARARAFVSAWHEATAASPPHPAS